MSIPERFTSQLHTLRDGWDGEGAPAPSSAAIEAATNAVSLGLSIGLVPNDVDADVLGGVALWFLSDSHPDDKKRCDRSVWVSIRNDGLASILFEDHDADKIKTVPFEPSRMGMIEAFLGGCQTL